mmetsp:Transcript_3542/g.16176  ORF Transcript_3542/g.16176 Transcript_3542/m.16176 type:complete len:89 (-) Transcript_3542:32-298(-)
MLLLTQSESELQLSPANCVLSPFAARGARHRATKNRASRIEITGNPATAPRVPVDSRRRHAARASSIADGYRSRVMPEVRSSPPNVAR